MEELGLKPADIPGGPDNVPGQTSPRRRESWRRTLRKAVEIELR